MTHLRSGRARRAGRNRRTVTELIIMMRLGVLVAVAVPVSCQPQGLPVTKQTPGEPVDPVESVADSTTADRAESLPRLVDLGAGKCIPCKMMAPLLEELKRDYAGQFEVEFIDVWKDPAPGREYGIKVIPTQIFFDASGAERFRHEGFFGKEDILKKWAELGVTLRPPQG